MQIELMELASSLLNNTPDILVWMVGIVISAIMVRWGGGKPEKMLLIGCCLMFAMEFFNPILNVILSSMHETSSMTRAYSARTYGLVRSIFSAVLSIPAIVLIVYAFWKKFRRQKEGIA